MGAKIATYLEMTSPDQLRPADPVAGLALEPVAATNPLVRRLHDRIAMPHGWSSLAWSPRRWAEWLATAGWHWVVRVDGQDAGLVSMEERGEGEVAIAVFGLVPEFVGRGYGGYALTLAVRKAWNLPITPPARRIWLHTSTADHPHALPNYRRRGFRPYRTEIEPA
ncbi:GNAT family N-acetyltransferase [Longimycelium tulufanense]|uniref:GNAT family N-acetyltransferase n=1 Tax=Longimycelium tulufanense TaxID=907463 RepID=UPI001E4BB48A|nr:GNAT family N-acetyltransferase [Longimycelium tulufanense]